MHPKMYQARVQLRSGLFIDGVRDCTHALPPLVCAPKDKPMEQPWRPQPKVELLNTFNKEELLANVKILQRKLKSLYR